uniref:DUF8211 domain-containing protein n=1 Tax=Rhizophagus irregularis (strain DAOM 181602 / DAOM 197198 / MUCL 43194) TaxID=747089 RepID=U9UIJ7_RHIID
MLLRLKIHPSNNSRTRKKQQKCFERACKRVFNHEKSNAALSAEDKLIAARRQRFLFTKSQYINKLIHHLKYGNKDRIPNPKDYKFLVPLFFFKPRMINKLEKSIIEQSTSLDHIPISAKIKNVSATLDSCQKIRMRSLLIIIQCLYQMIIFVQNSFPTYRKPLCLNLRLLTHIYNQIKLSTTFMLQAYANGLDISNVQSTSVIANFIRKSKVKRRLNKIKNEWL